MLVKAYAIRCDFTGCGTTSDTVITVYRGSAANEARRRLRSRGWRRLDGRDLCPTHARTKRSST